MNEIFDLLTKYGAAQPFLIAFGCVMAAQFISRQEWGGEDGPSLRSASVRTFHVAAFAMVVAGVFATFTNEISHANPKHEQSKITPAADIRDCGKQQPQDHAQQPDAKQ